MGNQFWVYLEEEENNILNKTIATQRQCNLVTFICWYFQQPGLKQAISRNAWWNTCRKISDNKDRKTQAFLILFCDLLLSLFILCLPPPHHRFYIFSSLEESWSLPVPSPSSFTHGCQPCQSPRNDAAHENVSQQVARWPSALSFVVTNGFHLPAEEMSTPQFSLAFPSQNRFWLLKKKGERRVRLMAPPQKKIP